MDESRIRLLQGMPVFGGTSKETLGRLLDRTQVVQHDAGAWFFEEGSRGTSTFVLEAGAVSVVKRFGDEQMLLRQLGEGDCFGEVALIDFGPRSASVRADEPCRALEFTARDLREISKHSMEEFALIYLNLARELSRRLRNSDERLWKVRVESGVAEDWTPGSP